MAIRDIHDGDIGEGEVAGWRGKKYLIVDGCGVEIADTLQEAKKYTFCSKEDYKECGCKTKIIPIDFGKPVYVYPEKKAKEKR